MKTAESYYDKTAKSYDENFDMLYFRIFDVISWRYIEPYIPEGPDALVLDAGGGTGRWAIRMAKKGCKVVLMDISEKMLEFAAKKAKIEGLHNITILKGDMTETGYVDDSFDMILCEHALFLFRDPDIVMNELKRVLKKNKRLIISAHNRYVQSLASLPQKPTPVKMKKALDVLLEKKHGTLNRQRNVKIYTWTPGEFRTMLERNGFHIEKIIGKGITMPLRISKDLFVKKQYSKDLFEKILQFELAMCEKKDATALAGHMQAVARKI